MAEGARATSPPSGSGGEWSVRRGREAPGAGSLITGVFRVRHLLLQAQRDEAAENGLREGL